MTVSAPIDSPVHALVVKNKQVLVKRDDLLEVSNGEIAGNKVRKLSYLLEHQNKIEAEVLLSHGGIQSNAMLAIASMAKSIGKEFVYMTKPIPSHVKLNPSGNYSKALALDVNIVELDLEDYKETFGGSDGSCEPKGEIYPKNFYWIPQGAACLEAESGIKVLADEIINYWKRYLNQSALKIFLPSGTGTTAAFLNKNLKPKGIQVFTVPCVGDKNYLTRQMKKFVTNENIPTIVEGKVKQAFAKPRKELLQIWKEMEVLGLKLDLIYGPRTWEVMLENWNLIDRDNCQIMYLHTGGIEGNESQLNRYYNKGKI